MNTVAGSFSKRLAEALQTQLPEDDRSQLVHMLVDVVNGSDSYTAGHSARVADCAAILARMCEFLPSEIENVRRAALVHDIGKIGIPEKVLRKHGPLTDDEMHLVRLHPIFGASLLSRIPEMTKLVPAVLHHHERWDGTGYPTGLSMLDIPREARIIAVADAYDAMTSYRTYAPALSSEEAMNELRHHSGTQFEPGLVDAMHEAFAYGLLERRSSSVIFPQSSGF
ncbi:MAG TPA: HD-GYP domain-containing protein [Actinomycetota bacterium]|nr:HD-GYP domain-containing protein [Actinomycetota bacterium]